MKKDIKRILVLSRSTKDCEKAVHLGISLARAYGAEISILHVMYDPFGLGGGVLFVPLLKGLEEEYQAMVDEVRRDLAAMIQKEKAEGMSIKEMIKDGKPIPEIASTIEVEKIDLLIVAAHDETRIEHMIYGRINHELIRRLPCSILLVKAD